MTADGERAALDADLQALDGTRRPGDRRAGAEAGERFVWTLGSGAAAPDTGADATPDDRSGRFWRTEDPQLVMAIKVALATGRPLLLQGRSGCGKSSLARAVANTLGRVYYEHVITARTTADDLLWSVDHLERLRDVQLAPADAEAAQRASRPEGYIRPGVLWWAISPDTAGENGSSDPSTPPNECPPADDAGAVVLIDEIDKADPDLANSLLVPIGSLEFRVHTGLVERHITRTRTQAPLLIITSNDERSLPGAIVRRCIVFRLEMPIGDARRAIAVGHLGTVDPSLLERVETVVLRARDDVSTAEYVDAVRGPARDLGLSATGDDAVWDQLTRVLTEVR